MRSQPAIIAIVIAAAIGLTASCGRRQSEADYRNAIDTIPMMVMQIQKCSRLYTAEYDIHKIVTFDDVKRLKGSLLGHDFDVRLPLGERKVAIPMDATLKAYIDFSGFSTANVERRGRHIIITLPDPQVELTATKIDQKAVREYVAITRSHFSDAELTALERQGRQAIVDRIPELDIVEKARVNAARIIIPMIEQMGFSEADITVNFRHDLDAHDLLRKAAGR